jgi:hypothetical protein
MRLKAVETENGAKTYAVFRNVAYVWDTDDPETILSDIHAILSDMNINVIKFKLLRPETLKGRRRLFYFNAHNFVIVTRMAHMYRRDLMRRIFKEYVLDEKVDGVVLIKKSALRHVRQVLSGEAVVASVV